MIFQKNLQVHSYQNKEANYQRIPFFRTNIREFTTTFKAKILELTFTKIKANFPGGDSLIERAGMLVRKFQMNP